MRYLLVGLGNIGAKRKAVLGDRCVATVDPVNPAADYRRHDKCNQIQYDAAILAVPNAAKVALLEYFLERGKPVLVEKPLIFDPDTAERLQQLAMKCRTIWYTSYNFRFEPHVVGLKKHLESDTIGRLYGVRMFYGNGSVAEIRGTWRDSRYGILEDMASHLIDLTGFLFGAGWSFNVVERECLELMNGPDHCILQSADGLVVLEASFLSWKNRWRIDVTGEKGALEMDGLTKWGRSELTWWRRHSSGPPDQIAAGIAGPDPTWAADLQHFEERVARGESSYENDLWISRTVMAAADA